MIENLVQSVVEQHYPNGELEELRNTILRFLAVDIELETDEMGKMGEEMLIDHIIERAYDVYRQKEEMIAQPLHEVVKNIHNSEAEEKPTRAQVIFTDGICCIHVCEDIDI